MNESAFATGTIDTKDVFTQTIETSFNKCKYCKINFTYEHELKIHEANHHPCSNCKKVFSRADNLKRHLKTGCLSKLRKISPKPIKPIKPNKPTTPRQIRPNSLQVVVEGDVLIWNFDNQSTDAN